MQIARWNGRILLVILLCASLPVQATGLANDPASNDSQATSLVYTVQDGDNLIKICGQYRHLTNHYSLTDLLTAIRQANNLESNFLKIGQSLRIPVAERGNGIRVEHPVSAGAEVRGIYLTAPACGVSSVLQRIDAFIEAGGNAVVFDAKDIDGGVSYLSGHPLASWGAGRSGPVISSLEDMIRRFDQRDLYVTARIALFLDGELGRQRPDLALQDGQGDPWIERGCTWVDPALEEVCEYNLALAVELARAGVDEVQFDYMRFPTNGWIGDDQGTAEATAERRRRVIENFLLRARAALDEFDVRISADLYGIMAWGRVEDLALTGQHVPTIAAQVDVICPMIYPSHFGPGFEGRRRPGDDPAYFVGEGTRRFRELVAGQAEIRPWLQAFPYGVSRYDEAYIQVQVDAARQAGGSGWSLWNPTCRYTVALGAIRPRESDPDFDVLAALADEESAGPLAPADGTAGATVAGQGVAGAAAPASISVLGLVAPIRDAGIQEPSPDQ